MEQWQLVGLITRRSLVRIQLPLPTVKGQRRVPLAFLMPPSSSGLGRHPFKVEVRGSNPLGGTKRDTIRSSGLSRQGVLVTVGHIGPARLSRSCLSRPVQQFLSSARRCRPAPAEGPDSLLGRREGARESAAGSRASMRREVRSYFLLKAGGRGSPSCCRLAVRSPTSAATTTSQTAVEYGAHSGITSATRRTPA